VSTYQVERTKGKPVIGITGPDRGGLVQWWFLALAIWRAGGQPKRIRPQAVLDITLLDGLLVGGGADIDPALYQADEEAPLPELSKRIPWHRRVMSWIIAPAIYVLRRLFSLPGPGGRDPERDAMEKRLLFQAVARGMPVLGICRGSQMINVFFGGTLHQDIKAFYAESPQMRGVLPVKDVTIAPDSKLREILKTDHARVNSLHHQAVHETGPAVDIVAREKAGIAQAIEHEEDPPMILGVQWHPEFMPQFPRQQRLFQELVKTARKHRDRAQA